MKAVQEGPLTSVSTWILTFNWLSLYWLALETCSSIPHSTASQPVHLSGTGQTGGETAGQPLESAQPDGGTVKATLTTPAAC